jgi:hypothetical protein
LTLAFKPTRVSSRLRSTRSSIRHPPAPKPAFHRSASGREHDGRFRTRGGAVVGDASARQRCGRDVIATRCRENPCGNGRRSSHCVRAGRQRDQRHASTVGRR